MIKPDRRQDGGRCFTAITASTQRFMKICPYHFATEAFCRTGCAPPCYYPCWLVPAVQNPPSRFTGAWIWTDRYTSAIDRPRPPSAMWRSYICPHRSRSRYRKASRSSPRWRPPQSDSGKTACGAVRNGRQSPLPHHWPDLHHIQRPCTTVMTLYPTGMVALPGHGAIHHRSTTSPRPITAQNGTAAGMT